MRLFMCCLALCFTTAVSAQAISDEMKADITALLETTGALKIGEQMGNIISQQIVAAMKNNPNQNIPAGAPELIVEVVREHISSFMSNDESIAGLVDIYARHYTHDEILAMTDFYHTPLGEKILAASPQIAQESAQFAQKLFLQRVPQIQQDITERLRAAGMQPQPQPQPQQPPQ